MFARSPHALLFTLVLASCGYHPVASPPKRDGASISRVAVPLASNQTSYPGIAAPFTAEVREKLAALGIDVVDGGGQTAVLSLVIASVHDETGMTLRRGDLLAPSDIAWNVEVLVSLDGADGARIIPPTRMSGGGRSFAPGSTAGEAYTGARTQREILGELASRIAAMVAMLQ